MSRSLGAGRVADTLRRGTRRSSWFLARAVSLVLSSGAGAASWFGMRTRPAARVCLTVGQPSWLRRPMATVADRVASEVQEAVQEAPQVPGPEPLGVPAWACGEASDPDLDQDEFFGLL